MTQRAKRRIVAAAIVAAVIIAGVWVLVSCTRGTGAANVTDYTVVSGPIMVGVECNGRVVSRRDVQIKCKAGGTVMSVPYDISDVVTAGMLLAELDPIDEERRVRQSSVRVASSGSKLEQARQNLTVAEAQLRLDRGRAQSALLSARAKKDDALSKYDRMKQLLDASQISAEVAETFRTAATVANAELTNALIALEELDVNEKALEIQRQNVALAQAEYDNALIDLELAQQRLKETKIYSPLDGLVAEVNIQVGQIISSPLNNVGEGTTLFLVSDLSRVFVLASVDESDIGKVSVGQRAIIATDAFPAHKLTGAVSRIATKGTSVSDVVTFEVQIEVLSPDKTKLKPEMTANVTIVSAASENAILVPAQAVIHDEDRTIVGVRSGNGQYEMRPVKTGIEDGTNIEIVEGLSTGQTVVLADVAMQSRWARRDNARAADSVRRMLGGAIR